MGTKRNILAEIEDIRDRTTSVMDLDSGLMKLLYLTVQANNLSTEDEEHEENAYFIVASVAAFETFFRWQIRTLIDSGDKKYIDNIRLDELAIKLNHDVAVALVGKRVTIGELVSHSMGLSSFEQMASIMSKLLGVDFIALVSNARQQSGTEVLPILADPDEAIARVKRALERRHIICHEPHVNIIDVAEIKALCSACYNFARASYAGISAHKNPKAPVSLDEAYKEAIDKDSLTRNQLATAERLFAQRLKFSREREAFQAAQEAWNAFVESEAVFFGSVQMNGNRGEYDALMTRVRLNTSRSDELNERVRILGRKVPLTIKGI